MTEILDHCKGDEALSKDEGFMVSYNGQKRDKLSTANDIYIRYS